jgi:hypothetical protein
VLALHTVGVTGAVLVCFLKESVAGGAIAVIGIVASAGAHGYVHWRLRFVIAPTPEQVADMEYDVALQDAIPPSPGVTPARPSGARDSSNSNTVRIPLRHEPRYAIYKLDRSVVAKTLSGTEPAAVDTEWPRRTPRGPRDPGDADAPSGGDPAAAAVPIASGGGTAGQGPTAPPSAETQSPPNPLSASDRRRLLDGSDVPEPERIMEVSL